MTDEGITINYQGQERRVKDRIIAATENTEHGSFFACKISDRPQKRNILDTIIAEALEHKTITSNIPFIQ